MKKISLIRAHIYVIDALLAGRYFGAHQILGENIPKGKPPEDKKTILKALNKIANKGFLKTKKKHYGVHVSIDPKRIKEIQAYLMELEKQG
ncbi:MAG: hypothetical protein ABH950_08845 [Candidatus Altiarchaeota archaeon]